MEFLSSVSRMFLALTATLVAVAASVFTHFDALPFLMPLALCSGVGYLVTSLFLTNYKPTRYVGKLLLSRIHYLVYNWSNHFVRSYWEVSSWFVTISALYKATGSLWLAVILGSVAGVALVLLSDLFSQVPFYETFEGSEDDGESVAEAVTAKLVTSAAPSSTFSWSTVLLVYGLSQVQHGLLSLSHSYSNVILVLLLIALGSLMMMVTADALVRWEVTKAAGKILEQRITQASSNWQNYPLRSAFETFSWLFAILGYYAYGGVESDSEGKRVLASVQVGILVGTVVLLVNQDLGRWFCAPTCNTVVHPKTLTTTVSGAVESDSSGSSKTEAAPKQDGQSSSSPTVTALPSSSSSSTSDDEISKTWKQGEQRRKPPCLLTSLDLKYEEYTGKEHPTLLAMKTEYPHLPEFTMEEVSKHCTLEDLWIVVNGVVLDLTEWAPKHPGGVVSLERFAGGDATDELLQFHPSWVLLKRLPQFVIGTVTDKPRPSPIQKDFRALHHALEERGFFEPRPGYYIRKLLVLCLLFCTAILSVLLGETTGWRMFGAMCLAVFWQQIAFIGHDAGHMAVSYDRVWDYKLGHVIANLTTGIGVGWWKATHNVHHAVPNSLYDDPDIAHLPVFAITPRFFESLWNTYHKRIMPFDWLARNIFIPYQHYLYYPIMGVARFNLYLQVVIWLAKSSPKHNPFRRSEIICLGIFWTWFILLVCQIPTQWERWAFVLLSHAIAGLLQVQITLSHFSMPVVEPKHPSEIGKNTGPDAYGGDFYTRNIGASLDVDCPPGLDWFHGGLQFQCVHHCFPRVNRSNLRLLKPVFQELCLVHNLRYHQLPFVDATWEIIRTLKYTAEQTKTWSPLIAESLNAHG